MKRIITSYAIAFGLLGAAMASPAPAPIAQPLPQDTPDPNTSVTFSLRDPEVTDFNTQNTSAPTTTGSHHHTSAMPSMTEIASFTAPNGGKYGATAIDGTVRIAGYALSVGGQDALVGGVRVSAADEGLVHEGSTAPWVEVKGSSTVEVVSTSTDEAGSTQVVSTSSTVAVGESTGSASASETGDSESASESAASATGGAAAGATARSKDAVSALAGIAGLLWVFG